MATKTDKKANSTLPLNTDELTPSSNITYNNEVVAIIAGLAANEVEGIAGMCTVSGSLKSKNRNITKGVKVEVGTEEVAVDLYVIVEYGIPIQRAAADAQENVRKAIESMTGLHVVRVDVHVQSVSFEQEKKALQAGAQNAALEAGDPVKEPEKLPESPKPVPAKEATSKAAVKEDEKETVKPAADAAEKLKDGKTVAKAKTKAVAPQKGKAAKDDKKAVAADDSKAKSEGKSEDTGKA